MKLRILFQLLEFAGKIEAKRAQIEAAVPGDVIDVVSVPGLRIFGRRLTLLPKFRVDK